MSALPPDAPDDDRPAFMVVQYGHEYLTRGEQLRTEQGVGVLSIDIGGTLGGRQPRWRKLGYAARLIVSLPQIVARARAFHPTIVYSSQQRWDVRVAILLASMLRLPHVVHLHFLPGAWLGRDVGWWLKRCRQVICVSDFLRLKAIEAKVQPARTVVVRNVLPLETVATNLSKDEARKALCSGLQIPTTDVLVGMVARLAPSKGQLELAHAMVPLLSQPDATCRLILVGSEAYPELGYAERLIKSVEGLGIAGRVHWLGARSDVPELLRAFDVFAHPSFDEACGLSVIEALLAGLPVVVWRDGGPVELVVDGETGILVETGNIVALTSALITLCQDEALRDRMRQTSLASTARIGNTHAAARLFRETLEQALTPSNEKHSSNIIS